MIAYRIYGHDMVINFECQKCGALFDCDVGTVTLPENSDKPDFEKEIICPKCGKLSMDEVLLTEIGQSQLTEVTLGFDSDDIFDFEDDELNGFGFYEGECQGCDLFTMLNDFGLCEECAGKLERDLLRQRDWDYSALAYGVPAEKREALRNEIIGRYGGKLELILPKEEPDRKRKKKKRGKRKKGRGKR
jgi:rubredoxin